jgi:hypothetical protein
LWGSGVEIVTDPFSRAEYNEIRLFAYLDCDFEVRRGTVKKLVFGEPTP